MRRLIATVGALAAGVACACGPDGIGPFVELGVGAHSIELDGPENRLANVLGEAAIGYRYDAWSVRYDHESGLFASEDGYGSNVVSFRWTWRW